MIYTVSQVHGRRSTEIKGSPFVSYNLGLAEHPTRVELLQKPESPELKEGDKIEGIIEAGREKQDGTRWPDRLKRAGQGGGFRPRDPKETASIVRQHSQEMAIRFYTTRDYEISVDEGLRTLKELIDWFEADVSSVRSEPPVKPPTTTREAAPAIPRDRAKSILTQAQTAGHAEGTELSPTLRAKLTAIGVQSGRITNLNVDQAEDIEAWLKDERHGQA